MKKWICFLLGVSVCLCLFGCGGKGGGQAESTSSYINMATAPLLDLDAYKTLYQEDPDQAAQTYGGKSYRYTGTVVRVEEDFCILGFEEFDAIFDVYKSYYELRVYLDADVLKTLFPGETYTFAGQLEQEETLPALKNAQLITE